MKDNRGFTVESPHKLKKIHGMLNGMIKKMLGKTTTLIPLKKL